MLHQRTSKALRILFLKKKKQNFQGKFHIGKMWRRVNVDFSNSKMASVSVPASDWYIDIMNLALIGPMAPFVIPCYWMLLSYPGLRSKTTQIFKMADAFCVALRCIAHFTT